MYIYIYITVPIIIGLPYVFIFYKASSYVMLMINESPGAECMLKAAPGWPQATFFTATGGEPRNKIAMV